MQFNSIEFIFCFLPLFLLAYYIFPQSIRSAVVILGSLLFYALSSGGNYWWLGILIGITVLAFLAGRLLLKFRKKWLLAFFLTGLLGILTFFKLYNGGRHLPAGMSFYLFQIAAYLIDVYRLKFLPEKKLSSFCNQIFLFPKLLSGPLMNPNILRLQDKYACGSAENLHRGLQQFILGLSLKVLLANRMGSLWSQAAVVGYPHISTPFAWMTLVAYAMQLFYDFYGYSLMAMGIAKMLGYELPENFLDPYASKTVSEFYRRWHASLGAWFREYLYFPLGGSRKGSMRTIFNLAVVWLFTGLWHGVGGNYILWAAILLFFIVNERLWLGKLMNKSHVICHIYVVVAILLSWVPFAVGDSSQMLVFFGRLFGQCGAALNAKDYILWGSDYFGLLGAGVFLATPLPRWLCGKLKESWLADAVVLVLFWISVFYIATAAQDPFMYFQY